MKPLARLFVVVCACHALALIAYAGPEPMRESKEVVPAPAPDCCDWAGFYLGLHIGGQFGNSESRFGIPEEANFEVGWDYSESGLVAGGQAGYNFQWKWLVAGLEADIGYMNLDGKGNAPRNEPPFSNFLQGESSSDFYTTFRGRIGVAQDCWLFYVTGGGIGVNYETRQILLPEPQELDSHTEEFNWGYTVGGGIERKIGCHWSVKLEYLYFNLEDQSSEFTPTATGVAAVNGAAPVTNQLGGALFHLSGETDGHIVRAGLNYHF